MKPQRLYWANAMFSAADRSFNTVCAKRLRDAGLSVFLPQEASVNDIASEPSSEAIFAVDTAEILRADAIIAVLDQETIDAGVACEIGIAYAAGLPIYGLYTDVRQHRFGTGRMYKNLYVIGAIRRSGGEVFDTLETLAHALTGSKLTHLLARPEPRPPDATSFDKFVSRLESWYLPSWDRAVSLGIAFSGAPVASVLDYGCGTGRAYEVIKGLAPDAKYVGYDASAAMIDTGRARHADATWSCDSQEVLSASGVFDVILLHFVLHDQPDQIELCRTLFSALRPGGRLHIIDLSVDDLPRTTETLGTILASPLRRRDQRLGPGFAKAVADATTSVATAVHEEVFDVIFPSPSSLDEYLSVFDIYAGADLPLGLASLNHAETRSRVLQHLPQLAFPWSDLRVFRMILLEKK